MPLYRKAEAELDTAGRVERSSLNELLSIIARHGFLGTS